MVYYDYEGRYKMLLFYLMVILLTFSTTRIPVQTRTTICPGRNQMPFTHKRPPAHLSRIFQLILLGMHVRCK